MTSGNAESRSSTRQRILAVAARLFTERGFDSTSVRDIAAELGIANPSLYYHFDSKEALLVELLAEPLAVVERSVAEAEQLEGDARTRRIIEGLLESLESHSGIAAAAIRDSERIPDRQRKLAETLRPLIYELIAEGAAEDNRDLRVMMAIAAVEGAVIALMHASPDSDSFVAHLRERRNVIVDLAFQLLR